ncbi:alpha,alpha-trehalose-phosphate synthase (UDP-forming) [Cutibacterium avidum]|uniref:alpha,alpha-trehalose-phosphate synthase (UDP-forming) n=1 Tax=Cutibacterium avidum TaxID=33010 RepID=UPI0008F58A20|nr:trehalose-6-phosphate synthase [Cutibacterium avidum]MDK7698562.1 trehalose-6-phosphate synthase [Cutibacterium avidum]OIJ78197.1 trehalose-phosphate synthase [Cutibacterium avidum]
MSETVQDKVDFLVIANRLPVDRKIDDEGNVSWQSSPGGLVTALEPVMQRKGGAWIGWHGAPDEVVEPFHHDGYDIHPVPLSAQEVEEYYEGFSNATLWPLYHDCVVEPVFHREWWDAFQKVNKRFAEQAAEQAAEGATVWVQDYQLNLVPTYLREMRPDLRIGFFLHIPFPPIELYSRLPWREELVEGLLGADLVGFQTPGAAANFLRLAKRRPGVTASRGRAHTRDGRNVVVRDFPISIDSRGFHELATSEKVQAETAKLREDLGNPETIIFGVDRLDYTKGLRQRIRAVGELFKEGKLDPHEVVFLQLATPSRERVEEYKILRDDINQLVGQINSKVGTIANRALVYRNESVPREVLAAMYQVADLMLVTPVRDGMNLVAKEYIACRSNDDSALVLSEFAGAARELKQAYMVNPYDIDGMKATIMKALTDSPKVKARKMRSMRRQVFDKTIDVWADDFLTELEGR